MSAARMMMFKSRPALTGVELFIVSAELTRGAMSRHGSRGARSAVIGRSL